jgi:stalled ribosome rescue protein Dom34
VSAVQCTGVLFHTGCAVVPQGIVKHVDFGVVKVVVLASPGFVKDDFLAFLRAEAIRTSNRVCQVLALMDVRL